MSEDTLKYPIGKIPTEEPNTANERLALIEAIAELPKLLKAAVAGLTDAQLDTPYRDGGWTVRQVVHHVADSHMNAVTRFKLALTEDQPTIKPYEEKQWAELSDTKLPVDVSLQLLDVLHQRWVTLLHNMGDADFTTRGYSNPEAGIHSTLNRALVIYSWHSKHHTAHITTLRAQKGW